MHETFREMLAGNARHTERVADQLTDLQAGQHPDVLTVCCGDSRVMQDDMWDNRQPGRAFTHSNIGNRVLQETGDGRTVSGDVLYPLVHTDTRTAVVVGHTGCGAVTAAYHSLQNGPDEPDGIAHCVELVADGIEDGFEQLPDGVADDEAVNRLVEYNVDRQVEFLARDGAVPDTVEVIGAVYDFHRAYGNELGAVHVVNVDGVRDEDRLRDSYPEIAARIGRLWAY